MRIVRIFGGLFAFQYRGNKDNELSRLLELWTDTSYLVQYARQNDIEDVFGFAESILENAERLEDVLLDLEGRRRTFGQVFGALSLREDRRKELSLRKAKQYRLRLYAIRIDSDCYVITGGAIKMSHFMEDHLDTHQELVKLQKARAFLQENGVRDDGSFFEWIAEME